jgi:hypothetical protein
MNNVTTKTRSAPAVATAAIRRRTNKHSTNGDSKTERLAKPRQAARKRTPNWMDYHREAQKQATMTGTGGTKPESLEIDYSRSDVSLDLSADGYSLLHGPLVSELVVDGRAIETTGEWNSACSYADDEGAYLELQLCLTDSLRIDRQLFLARDHHFLLLADAVVATGATRVDYCLHLPLATGAALKADTTTREWRVGPARIFPLWLPQDRVLSAVGNCIHSESRLDMSYTVGGPGLYLPVVIDWHPRRRRTAADWRTLTVTEPGRVVSPSGAAAHRLRLGTDQLVIFRGLAPTHDPRAVLGMHIWYESLFGWFKRNGVLDPLMATEAE